MDIEKEYNLLCEISTGRSQKHREKSPTVKINYEKVKPVIKPKVRVAHKPKYIIPDTKPTQSIDTRNEVFIKNMDKTVTDQIKRNNPPNVNDEKPSSSEGYGKRKRDNRSASPDPHIQSTASEDNKENLYKKAKLQRDSVKYKICSNFKNMAAAQKSRKPLEALTITMNPRITAILKAYIGKSKSKVKIRPYSNYSNNDKT